MPVALDLSKQSCPRILDWHLPHETEALCHILNHLVLIQVKNKANFPLKTIASWMVISHLPSSSLRGWLLGEGKGRQMSTVKFK